jgi:hypothetical protein
VGLTEVRSTYLDGDATMINSYNTGYRRGSPEGIETFDRKESVADRARTICAPWSRFE